MCVNGSCCGPGPGGPRGWPRQADFSHVVPSHKLPAFTSITFTGTSRVVANTGQVAKDKAATLRVNSGDQRRVRPSDFSYFQE